MIKSTMPEGKIEITNFPYFQNPDFEILVEQGFKVKSPLAVLSFQS